MPKKRYKKKGKRSYGYGKGKSYRTKSRKSGRTKTNMMSGKKSAITFRPSSEKGLSARLKEVDDDYKKGRYFFKKDYIKERRRVMAEGIRIEKEVQDYIERQKDKNAKA